ncbi:hypothetical protein DL93DRAFT_2062685, partial [Clavulina sp. PMI_390]
STYVPTPPLSGRSTPFQSNASSFHDHRSAEQLESQNDEMIDGIGAKVQQLRALAIGIGQEAKDSTIQLTQMNDAFSETGDILGGTFRRMNAMAKRQGSRWMCYMLFIILVIWFFIFVWWFR